jgi:DNA transformation protein
MSHHSFKDFVLDQLSALPAVNARAMFGAHGLYQGEHFFGILDEGRLFFKTDATMSYHEVPPEVLENPAELVVWAQRAIQAAATGSGKPKKVPKQP